MPDALSDTGPLLHLHEIQALGALAIFDCLIIPQGVAQELERFELPSDQLIPETNSRPVVKSAPPTDWKEIHRTLPDLSPADSEVLAAARGLEFLHPVLTDDLTLRQQVEREGGLVVGTLGILLRNYRVERYTLTQLEVMVQRLLTGSTLHVSRPFQAYVQTLLESLK